MESWMELRLPRTSMTTTDTKTERFKKTTTIRTGPWTKSEPRTKAMSARVGREVPIRSRHYRGCEQRPRLFRRASGDKIVDAFWSDWLTVHRAKRQGFT